MKLPNGFQKIALGDVAKISSGGTPSRNYPAYWGGNIPWVKTTQIQNCFIEKVNIDEWITNDGLKHSSAKMVPKGTLLLAMIGQGKTRGQVGYLMIDASTNQNAATIECDDSTNSMYLFQYILFRYKQIRGLSNSSGQQNLNLEIVRSIPILLPPLPVQKAIADLLSTWDEVIEKIERLIAAKKKRFKWLLNALINNKVFAPEADKHGWKKMRLGNVGRTYTGLSGKSKDDFGEGKPFLPYLNIYQNSRINPEQLDYVKLRDGERQNKVLKGDVFFTTSSETPDEVGISSVLLDDLRECYLNSICFGWRPHTAQILPEYFQYYFRSSLFRMQTYRLAQGATRYNLSKTELMKTNVYFPDILKQKQIVETLNAAQSEINLLENIVKKYKKQKRGLMQKLLTGQWRVKEKE